MEELERGIALIERLYERYQTQGMNARIKFIELVKNPPEVIEVNTILEASVLLNAMADSEMKIAMITGMIREPENPEPLNENSHLNVVN